MQRMIVRKFVNGEKKLLDELGLKGKKILSVSTVLDEELLYPKFDDKTGEPLKTKSLDNISKKHWHSIFIEDKLHDWDVYGEYFGFHGHSGDIGDLHDLLIEYE